MKPSRLLPAAAAFVLAAAALPASACAQQAPRPMVTADHIRFILSALADDSMEGRGTGTPGSMRAARLIAEQFRLAGLTPAGDSGFFQHVPMVTRMLDPNSTITAGGTTLKALTDFLVGVGRVDPRSIDGAEVMYGGVQGDTASPLTADQVRGKLVIFSPAPPPDPGARGGRGGARGGGGAGGRAVGPPSCRDTAAFAAYNAARGGGGRGGGGGGGNRGGARGGGAASPLAEAAGVATIAGDRLPYAAAGNAARPGSAFSADATRGQAGPPSFTITTRAAEVLLGSPLVNLTKGMPGKTVRSGVRFIESNALGGNVVGIIAGSDPALKDEVVLVDAHYDHLGIRTPVTPGADSIYNGADDDASGTTAVIEIARAIKAGPPPRRTLVLIATTGEEVGLLGTNYYIAHPVRPLTQMAANLEIEMMDRPDSLAGPPGHAWLTGFERSTMGDMFAAAGLPVVPDKRPEQNFFQRSDNIAFARMGIPAHTLSSFDLHADYHQPNDEVKLADFNHMAGVINAAVTAVRILTDGKRPEWYPGCKP